MSTRGFSRNSNLQESLEGMETEDEGSIISMDSRSAGSQQITLQELKEESYEMTAQQEALREKYEKAKQDAYLQHFELQSNFNSMFSKYLCNMENIFESKLNVLKARQKRCETAYKLVSRTPRHNRAASVGALEASGFSLLGPNNPNNPNNPSNSSDLEPSLTLTNDLDDAQEIEDIEQFEFETLQLHNIMRELKFLNNNLILDAAWSQDNISNQEQQQQQQQQKTRNEELEQNHRTLIFSPPEEKKLLKGAKGSNNNKNEKKNVFETRRKAKYEDEVESDDDDELEPGRRPVLRVTGVHSSNIINFKDRNGNNLNINDNLKRKVRNSKESFEKRRVTFSSNSTSHGAAAVSSRASVNSLSSGSSGSGSGSGKKSLMQSTTTHAHLGPRDMAKDEDGKFASVRSVWEKLANAKKERDSRAHVSSSGRPVKKRSYTMH